MVETIDFTYWKEGYGFAGSETIETNHKVVKIRENLDELANPYLEEESAADGIMVTASYYEESEDGSVKASDIPVEIVECMTFKQSIRSFYDLDSHTYHIGIEDMKDAFVDQIENLDKEALKLAIEYQAFLLRKGIRADVSEDYKKNNPEIEQEIAETDPWTKFMDEYNSAKERERTKNMGEQITKGWMVYGREGHRQRESFGTSCCYDWSNEDQRVRYLQVCNSDQTGTNDYSIVFITGNSEDKCEAELEAQLTDGIFENSATGMVVELTSDSPLWALCRIKSSIEV